MFAVVIASLHLQLGLIGSTCVFKQEHNAVERIKGKHNVFTSDDMTTNGSS